MRQMEEPETHTKRQATQHGCLPSLLGGGNKEIEIVYGEEKIFSTRPIRAAKVNNNLLHRHDKPIEPTKKGPLSLDSLSPHSTVSRGHSSQVSMATKRIWVCS
jgi:hypothetical protein